MSTKLELNYGSSTDEVMKAAVHLTDNILDIKTATSQEILDSPFSRAFGRQHFFEFLEKPENGYRFRRFTVAMGSRVASNTSGLIMAGNILLRPSEFHNIYQLLEGFDWKSLAADALVVDVGGGAGWTTLLLKKAYPHLRYIVEDRPIVVAHGIKVGLNIKKNPNIKFIQIRRSGRMRIQKL